MKNFENDVEGMIKKSIAASELLVIPKVFGMIAADKTIQESADLLGLNEELLLLTKLNKVITDKVNKTTKRLIETQINHLDTETNPTIN